MFLLIGLIILVVVVMMLTGKLGAFGEGVDAAFTCESVCDTLGYGFSGIGLSALSSSGCNLLTISKIVPGKFSDIPESTSEGDPAICCCFSSVN